jgi:hypothetical protein
MKKNLIIKIAGSFTFVLLLSIIINDTRPNKDYSTLLYDWFWTQKTHYAKGNNIVFMGDSRIYRGISSESVKSVFPKQKVLNLGYSSGGLNQYMFDVAYSLLDKKKKVKIIVLGVTPFSMTEAARENEHFKQELERPLAEVVERNYLNPYLSIFESISFVDYKTDPNKINYPQVFHENGWIESSKTHTIKTEVLSSYRKTFSKTIRSEKSISETLKFVAQMKNKGIAVYGFRPPTCQEMEKLENQLSGFNEDKFKNLFIAAGGRWIDIPNRFSFNTYDGSHLHYESAKKLSLILAKKIKNE